MATSIILLMTVFILLYLLISATALFALYVEHKVWHFRKKNIVSIVAISLTPVLNFMLLTIYFDELTFSKHGSSLNEAKKCYDCGRTSRLWQTLNEKGEEHCPNCGKDFFSNLHFTYVDKEVDYPKAEKLGLIESIAYLLKKGDRVRKNEFLFSKKLKRKM